MAVGVGERLSQGDREARKLISEISYGLPQ
jgi:hypothetical protein